MSESIVAQGQRVRFAVMNSKAIVHGRRLVPKVTSQAEMGDLALHGEVVATCANEAHRSPEVVSARAREARFFVGFGPRAHSMIVDQLPCYATG